MSLKLIVTKLQLMNKKIITSEELKGYCKDLNQDYYATIRYLTYQNYVARILKGIFYIRSLEERKLNKTDFSYLEIIRDALKTKRVKHWYFGLETALKLNNMTHEYFSLDCVISDSIFRARPITILGHKVKFTKLSPRLISFGIKNNSLPYSNPEKTVLDLVYLGKYSKEEFLESSRKVSKRQLIRYSKNYDARVRATVSELK